MKFRYSVIFIVDAIILSTAQNLSHEYHSQMLRNSSLYVQRRQI